VQVQAQVAKVRSVVKHILGSSPKLVAIVGPTASGKSDFAIELAIELLQHGIKADIVNADTYARYRGMDIGTAKVSATMRHQILNDYGINHYQIDVASPDFQVSAAEYQTSALADIATIHERGRLPIICGGSGLYIRVLTDNFTFQKTDTALRKDLEARADREGVEVLYRELQSKDPQTAATIDSNNLRRIVRALEVIELSGQNYQNHLPKYAYREPQTCQFYLDVDRATLDKRIELRTQKMRELGLVEEVRHLQPVLGVTARKAIGYAEVLQLLNNEANPANGRPLDIDATFEMIAQHTKRLVRKQQSWFLRDGRIIRV
jgi:tRNA dimethylallyltransferase